LEQCHSTKLSTIGRKLLRCKKGTRHSNKTHLHYKYINGKVRVTLGVSVTHCLGLGRVGTQLASEHDRRLGRRALFERSVAAVLAVAKVHATQLGEEQEEEHTATNQHDRKADNTSFDADIVGDDEQDGNCNHTDEHRVVNRPTDRFGLVVELFLYVLNLVADQHTAYEQYTLRAPGYNVSMA
jgi:hypothetical protein